MISWSLKKRIYRNVKKLTFVAASKWLIALIKKSPLTRPIDVFHIPYGVDMSIMSPMDKTTARQLLGSPSDSKVILTFAEFVPTEIGIEGLLHCRRSEKQLELTLVGVEDSTISEWAESVKAQEVHIPEINLEDQFIEFTAPANRKRLFQWEEV